ncbi:MAG: hypothetical protein U9Q16_00295 [Patescibacteria group bacterium]|nr:hypothetical protein [Patescibacteria group bacterium]
MLYLKQSYRFIRHILIFPIISISIIPLIILDISIEIYHRISFPLYEIPFVKRRNYIRIDRHKLKYLNVAQKFYCAYCGYANGVIQYWAKIAGETERYWCGIRHKENNNFVVPEHHKNFPKHGDENSFKKKYYKK